MFKSRFITAMNFQLKENTVNVAFQSVSGHNLGYIIGYMLFANIILRKHDYLIFDASFIKSYIFATPAFYRQIKLACFIISILNKNLI